MSAHEPGIGRAMARSLEPGTAISAAARPRVRITADLVCPWSWIGFTRLITALAGAEDVELVWEPFLLNPHLPTEGMPLRTYLGRRFGGPTQARLAWSRAAQAAAASGLELRFQIDGRQPNTLLPHALVLAAAGQGRLEAAAGTLFSLFLCEGRDIGDPALLEPVAASLGLRLTDAVARLDQALASHNAACRDGLDGVPVVRFGDDHALAGAQTVEVIRSLLDLERYRLALAPR